MSVDSIISPFKLTTDINECLENPSVCGDRECENTYGTYTCVEPPTTQAPSTTTTTEVSMTSSTTEATSEFPEILEKVDEGFSDVEDVETNEIPEGEEEEDDERSQEESQPEMIESSEDIDDIIEIQHEVIKEETHSTPEAITLTPASEIPREPSTTDMSNEISGQNESEIESGEDSNDDEEHSEVEEEKHTEIMHHQSSTVKSNVGSECDDGLRLDSNGKCVGE